MDVTLSNEDAFAIDLLLDRSSAAGAGGNGGPAAFVQAADGVSPERVRAAEKVLRLLSLMPADEPAADLTARTLTRLERFQPASMQRPALDPLVHSPHPHA